MLIKLYARFTSLIKSFLNFLQVKKYAKKDKSFAKKFKTVKDLHRAKMFEEAICYDKEPEPIEWV